ncbi:MAG: hypothetical protein K5891_10620 [Lachnospiraceae bacterium]|nr:hypothetical protein [Lachnospiraceae bacterium]
MSNPVWGIFLSGAQVASVLVMPMGERVAALVVFVCFGCVLLSAARMDYRTALVYDLYWWIALALAGGLLWWRLLSGTLAPSLYEIRMLILYLLMQESILGRGYGKADAHCFCSCGILFAALGLGPEAYVVHMGLSFVALIIREAHARNISALRLITPVPFLPVIVPAFFVTIIIFHGGVQCRL